jgi:type IV pilus assembly protein PilC
MRFSSKHLAAFYYQLGTLVQAGLPIQQALVSTVTTAPRPMRSAVAALSAAVGGGIPLHEAMEQDERRFSRFDGNAIRMTEHSGALDVGLLSLSHYHENRAAARKKLVSGSAYPVLLLVAGVFISNFPALFLGMRNDKPYSLLDYGRDTVGLLGLLVLIGWGAVRLLRWLCTIPGVNATLERFLLAVPVFGRLRFNYALSQWVSSIRLMLKAGIGIVPALETASRMVDSPLIAAAYLRAAPLINSQMDVSAALASTGVFPDYLVQLWSTGEKSGQMDEMLDKLAVFYEESWRTSLDHAVTWLPRITYALVVVYMICQIFSLFGSYMKVYDDILNTN